MHSIERSRQFRSCALPGIIPRPFAILRSIPIEVIALTARGVVYIVRYRTRCSLLRSLSAAYSDDQGITRLRRNALTTSLIEAEVLRASQIHFGTEIHISRGFLFYLQPEGLKAAYRNKAKETNPDLFACEPPNVQKEQAAHFRDVVDAYDIVSRYFKQWEKGSRAASSRHVFSGPREWKKQSCDPNNREYAREAASRPLPLRSLQIGQYLYYRGFITYRALINAVVWQRQQRPVIGDIALRWRWLDHAAIERIMRARGLRGRFGEKALHLDLLTPFRIKVLLYYQISRQERLGSYFVKHGIITSDKLEWLVRQLNEHNVRFRNKPLRADQYRNAFV